MTVWLVKQDTSLSLDMLACAGGNTDMDFIQTANVQYELRQKRSTSDEFVIVMILRSTQQRGHTGHEKERSCLVYFR